MDIKLIEVSYDLLMRGYRIATFLPDKLLYEIVKGGKKKMDYYDLPNDKRWLGGGSPLNIGGRDTDVSQIAYSLKGRVRELYDINEVPAELVAQLKALQAVCDNCETEIGKTIELISDFMAQK